MRRYAASSDLLNRWVELGVAADHEFKFFLTYMNPYYLGGHLMRSSLRAADSSAPPLRYNHWNFIKLRSGASVNFFLTEINDQYIAGHLVRSEIATIDFTIVRYQQFFGEYALRLRRNELVQQAEQTLQARVVLRELAAGAERIPQTDELPTLAEPDLRRLSELQLELYQEFFGQSGELDYAAIQTCFELYGGGELQSSKYPGHLQPDAASYSLFAEFALHAIEGRVAPDIWSKLLVPLVATQELFLMTCRPDGMQAAPADAKRKAHLRRKYDAMSVEELQRAYAENLLKARAASASP